MKKIIFSMPNLPGGGAEKVLIDILKNINKNKYNITLLLNERTGIYLDEIPSHVKVISIQEKFNKMPMRVINKLGKFFPKTLYKLVVKDKFDIEVAFMEGLPTRLIGNSNNKDSKKIAWVHIDLLKYHFTKNEFKKGGELSAYNNFDEIVFVSNDAKSSFEDLFDTNKSNKKVIYNPIISHEVIEKSESEVINFDDKFTIVSVGRLEPQKGYDRLIRAHSKLVKRYPHKLVILGEGRERESLEAIISDLDVKDTVDLKGFVKNPYPYIKSADLFVSSSIAEGYSLVVAESIILGKAIISTETTGPKELLDNGKYGVLCENSEEGLVDSIKQILENKHEIEKYEELSKIRKEYFDYKSIIKQVEDLFDN